MQKLTLEEFKKATHDYERRDMMHWMLENCDRDFLANIMADHIETRTVLRELSENDYLFNTVVAYSCNCHNEVNRFPCMCYGHDLKAGTGDVYDANDIEFSWEKN
jgi:hypothetical protein